MELTCPLNYNVHYTLEQYLSVPVRHLILVRTQEQKDAILGEILMRNFHAPDLHIILAYNSEPYHYMHGERRPYILIEDHMRVAHLANRDALLSWV